MSRSQPQSASGYTILVVDDDPECLRSTANLLSREGHEVLTAADGAAALRIHDHRRPDLILLDPAVSSPDSAVVRAVRAKDPLVQILLVGGHASETPPRAILRRLAVNGFHEKSEGPERLLVWIDSALRARRQLGFVTRHRRATQHMLEICPEILALRTEDEVARLLLERARDVAVSFAADGPEPPLGPPDGLVVLSERLLKPDDLADGDLPVRHASGRFAGASRIGALHAEGRLRVRRALQPPRVVIEPEAAVIPVRLGPEVWGFAYLEGPSAAPELRDLFEGLAVLVAATLRNSRLLRVATVDTLTGTDSWHYFASTLRKSLRTSPEPAEIPVLAIAVDGIRDVLRQHGSVAADRRLREVGSRLSEIFRDVGRIAYRGGAFFSLLLTDRSSASLERATEAVYACSRELAAGPDGPRLVLRVGRATCSRPAFVTDPRRNQEALEAAVDAFERDFDRAVALPPASGERRHPGSPTPTASSGSSAPPPGSHAGSRT
jgi:two-component system, cell cycle response regulator